MHLPYAATIQEAAIAHHKAALEICQLTVATAKTGNKKLTPALFGTNGSSKPWRNDEGYVIMGLYGLIGG